MQKKRMIVCLLIAALFSGMFEWEQPILTYAAEEGNVAEETGNLSLETPEGSESEPEGEPESGMENEPEDEPEGGTESEPEDTPESGTEGEPEDTPESGTEGEPEGGAEGTPENGAEGEPEDTPEDGTESEPEDTLENGTESVAEDVPESGMETNALESPELSLETTFPDVGLRLAVSVYDADQSGSLNETELKSATALISPNTPIANLAGLEKLVYLNYVDLSNTGLTDYTPITALTNLIALKLDGNNAVGLDVRGAKNLQSLSCKNSGLTSLDVENLSALRELRAEGNALTVLHLAGLTALECLTVQDNRLTSLDASPCVNLRVLQADGNQLTGLHVAGLLALVQLDCQNNQLVELQVNGLPALEQLNVSNNCLTALDITGLEALYSVYAGGNQLSGTWNTGQAKCVSLEGNQVGSLTEGSAGLHYLNVRKNMLETLTLTSAVRSLYCSDNRLSGLDLADYGQLETMYCENNKLPYLETAQALDLSLSPQAISLDRVKQGAQHTTDLRAVMTMPEMLERTEVVQTGLITAVRDGVVSFGGAESNMQYRYKTSTATNAMMTVDANLTEVDQTEPPTGSPDDGNGTTTGGNSVVGGNGTAETGRSQKDGNVKTEKKKTASKVKESGDKEEKEERKIPQIDWMLAETESKNGNPPEVFDKEDNKYFLIAESINEQAQKELLRQLESDETIKKAWADMNRHSWIEIYLRDPKTEELVQPSADVSFRLSYPKGTTEEMEFVLVHIEGGNNPVILTEGKDFVKEKKGFLITVDNFSPFVISWRAEAAEDTETGQKAEVPEEKPAPAEEEERAESSGGSLLLVILLLAAAAVGGTELYIKNKKR